MTDDQQDSRLLNAFVPSKSFGQLLEISLKKKYFQKDLIQSFHILKHKLLKKILTTRDIR